MSKPSFDTLEKIKAQYPQVNLEWLVMGTGQPLRGALYPVSESSVAGVSEPDIKPLGKPQREDPGLQAALAECQRELAIWKEKAETYKQLADDRQTIIELMKKAR
ncbi:hypothetical protein [Hymenobacter edaphi]|nr:hypothetical protein [Hymenobacter edaphi]